MKKLYYFYKSVGIGIAFSSVALNAVADELDELLDLDIADLTISVASKTEESVYQAPNVVNVITAKDIKRYGARNLRDVLERQTHIQFTNSVAYHDTVVTMRGNNFTHSNTHVLFLVNGRPYRESKLGGIVSALVKGFPISAIDKIEIIRGPGSVLYGANAYAGVINIITGAKSGEDGISGVASGTYGSFNSGALEATASQKSGDATITAAAKTFSARGWQYIADDSAGNEKNFRTDDYAQSMFLAANYKNATVNLLHGKSKYKSMEFRNVFPPQHYSDDRIFADVGFNHKLFGETWKAQYNVTYNRDDFFEQKSEDILGEVNVRGKIAQKVGMIAGAAAEHHNTKAAPGFGPENINGQLFWGYAQLDYTPLDWLKLVGGVQVNKPSRGDENYSPRLAAIANFTENWGAKVMYGEAFRSPDLVEQYYFIPGILYGNPDIKPETIATTEAQLFYHDNGFDGAVTVFNSKVEDLITRTGFPVDHVNNGEVDFYGVELEGRARLSDALSLVANATWQTNENQNGVDNTTFAPNWSAKAGISYNKNGYTFGVYDSFFGEPTALREIVPATDTNPDADAYHLVTLNAEVELRQALQRDNMPDVAVGMFVDNALDEDIRYPDYNTRELSSVPNRSGRAVYATIKIRF